MTTTGTKMGTTKRAKLGDKVTGNYYGSPFVGILVGADSGYYIDTLPFAYRGQVRDGLFLTAWQWRECVTKVEDFSAALSDEDVVSAPGTIADGSLSKAAALKLLARAAVGL